jgi:hypothetical protein
MKRLHLVLLGLAGLAVVVVVLLARGCGGDADERKPATNNETTVAQEKVIIGAGKLCHFIARSPTPEQRDDKATAVVDAARGLALSWSRYVNDQKGDQRLSEKDLAQMVMGICKQAGRLTPVPH